MSRDLTKYLARYGRALCYFSHYYKHGFDFMSHLNNLEERVDHSRLHVRVRGSGGGSIYKLEVYAGSPDTLNELIGHSPLSDVEIWENEDDGALHVQITKD